MIDNNIREQLLTYVVNAAVRGGAAIMEIYNSPNEYEVSFKSDNSPITAADRAAHDAIKEALGATRIPIFSEEGREMLYEERKNWEMFWLVDPLDGTVEFINHNDEFTVNIALMYKGSAIGSVIYVPAIQRLYIAGRSLGARVVYDIEPDSRSELKYDDIIEHSTELPLKKEPNAIQKVAVSRSHITNETNKHIEELRLTHPDIEVVEQGSSYKFCLLAEGAVDYYIRTSTTYEWDTAAGELILSEAGGKTRTIEGLRFEYNKRDPRNEWFKCRSAQSKIRF